MAKLYLVPTPIGNLEDITLRAIRILKEADVIYAEDTRTSAILLKHLGIEKKISSFHQHNEHKILSRVLNEIQAVKSTALITDAGTPGISDPGFLLVRECIRNGIEMECLPGPTAFVPALVNSGLPSDRFLFEGFLPQKKGRASRLEVLKEVECTLIFYESPFRLVKTLEQLCEVFGTERQASVSRELTKMFEETRRGTLADLIGYFSSKTVKGELVVVVAGRGKEKAESDDE
jgi:16S rRNA (cytidine1402-2'-O)-methyltransferase